MTKEQGNLTNRHGRENISRRKRGERFDEVFRERKR